MFTENWYDQGGLDKIAQLTTQIKVPGLYVEIGCWQGKSSSEIAKAIAPRPLYCVDTWAGNIGEGEDHATVTLAKERDIYAEFLANMKELTQGNFFPIRMDGDKFLEGISGGSLAFLHLDATHTYEAVNKTVGLALSLMKPGALICGDDYNFAPVQSAVREHIPNPECLGALWWHFKD